MSKYTIGIDLGGTTMTAGIVNENYEIVGKLTWATRLPRPAEDLEKALADLCRTVARDNKVDFADIKYVGIGTPGSVNFTTGFVGFNTNFGYYDWNLGPDLEALLGCKVYVENDANAAAYGEYIAGGAKGYNDAVVITLGTGIGSGIILGGKILRGFNFAAGEMGHNVIVKDGIQCTCGRKGCWERYASASALTRETKSAMQANKNTIMWKMTQDIDHVNAKLAFDAMAKGDETAKQVVDSWIEYVGVGIANVINIFEPEVIWALRISSCLAVSFNSAARASARAGASFRLLAFRATAVLASVSVRSSSRSSTPKAVVASMRRIPAATLDSLKILKQPICAVLVTWVPPQNSVLQPPASTTRTTLPYFSPNSAIAPIFLASSMGRFLTVTGSAS